MDESFRNMMALDEARKPLVGKDSYVEGDAVVTVFPPDGDGFVYLHLDERNVKAGIHLDREGVTKLIQNLKGVTPCQKE